jgi:serpin B
LGALAASPLHALDCASGLPSARPVDASTPAGATAASNAFGFDLYARLGHGTDNLICSPLSAAVALNMASAGAREQTLAQMLTVLHIDPLHAAEAHASFGGLLGALNARDGMQGLALHVADRLWGDSAIAFKPEFVALLRDSYAAPLETVDIIRANEAARTTINQWVATQTRGRITEILAAGDLPAGIRLVLINAVYFKATWANPFDELNTRPRRFAGVSGAAEVPMMAQEGGFAYARDGDMQIIELPYRGDLSMVVVLPDGAGDLPEVERMVARKYAAWLSALHPTRVSLRLPRWTTRSRLDLVAPLAAAGMPLAFTDGANFGGISNVPLSIDKVLQEAFIDVTEPGTEAAAATAATMKWMDIVTRKVKPEIFHADHPFLYLIRDRKTGAVLFLGRVTGFGA